MKIAFVTVLALVALLIWLSSSQHEAMKECQKTHSYDTCFQLLNR